MDRPQPLDPGSAFPAAPDALSHRQLVALLRQAPRDGDPQAPTDAPEAEAAAPGTALRRLEDLLQEQERLAQAILEELSGQGDALQGRYSPPQLMALGALAAHLRLGLQALEASRR